MWELCLIIFLVIILIYYMYQTNSEHYTIGSNPHPDVQPTPFIKLYDSFQWKGLVFEHFPEMNLPAYKYVNTFYRGTVKSIDLNLPKQDDNLDSVRNIQVWGVNGSDNLASSECDFYNPFTEPDWAKRANYVKYKLLGEVRAGERIRIDLNTPIKKVYIYARM